ncbi:MAG TPA: energy transducer TonB [Terriglobales bacterium]|nr:energy transducer TonB [Terriglobales bacterium]
MRLLNQLGLLIFLLLTTCLWAQSDSSPKPQTGGTSEKGAPSQPASKTDAPSPAVSDASVPESTASSPGDSSKLEPLKIQKATYPAEAAQKQIQGQVWVKLMVSETGDVENVEVVSGDPVLARAAVDAVKKWKFKPFIKNGKPVKVSTKVPLDFAFSDKISDTPSPASSGNATATPKRVQVAQGVSQGLLVHKVTPVYPATARQDRVQGTVLLRAVIGKDGRIHELTRISGPKELVGAAIGAVQQWRYKPYMLNNEPVEVETQVVVNFQLRPF